MKSIFTYPNNPLWIDPDYVGDADSGFYRRVSELIDGDYKAWEGGTPATDVNYVMSRMSAYNNVPDFERNDINTFFKFWSNPLYEAEVSLITDDISSANTGSPSVGDPITFTFDSPHGFYEGEKYTATNFDGTLSTINAADYWVKVISSTEIQLSTNSDLNQLLQYFAITTDTISSTSLDELTYVITPVTKNLTTSDTVVLTGADGTLSRYNGETFYVKDIDANTYNLYYDSAFTQPLQLSATETDIEFTEISQAGGVLTVELASGSPAFLDGSLFVPDAVTAPGGFDTKTTVSGASIANENIWAVSGDGDLALVDGAIYERTAGVWSSSETFATADVKYANSDFTKFGRLYTASSVNYVVFYDYDRLLANNAIDSKTLPYDVVSGTQQSLTSVSVDMYNGDRIVIGSPSVRGTTDDVDYGVVQIYDFNPLLGTWGEYELSETLLSSENKTNVNGFGSRVIMNTAGDTLMVSSNPAFTDLNIQVFELSGGTWSQIYDDQFTSAGSHPVMSVGNNSLFYWTATGANERTLTCKRESGGTPFSLTSTSVLSDVQNLGEFKVNADGTVLTLIYSNSANSRDMMLVLTYNSGTNTWSTYAHFALQPDTFSYNNTGLEISQENGLADLVAMWRFENPATGGLTEVRILDETLRKYKIIQDMNSETELYLKNTATANVYEVYTDFGLTTNYTYTNEGITAGTWDTTGQLSDVADPFIASTTGTLETIAIEPWVIEVATPAEVTNGTLTIATSETNRYRLSALYRVLPGNLTYQKRTGASTYENAAYVTDTRYLQGTGTAIGYTGVKPTYSVSQNGSGYLLNVTYTEAGRFSENTPFMITLDTQPDTYTPPAPTPAELEDVWNTADYWTNNQYNENKVWPRTVRPRSVNWEIDQPASATVSQNGNRYVRRGGRVKYRIEAEYPPMTYEQFSDFWSLVQAANGMVSTFQFPLNYDGGYRILFPSNPNAPQEVRLRNDLTSGDTTMLLEGFPSNQSLAFKNGEVFINEASLNGTFMTVIHDADSNIYGEVKIRVSHPAQLSIGTGTRIYQNPDHIHVTLDVPQTQYTVDAAGYYYLTVSFIADYYK